MKNQSLISFLNNNKFSPYLKKSKSLNKIFRILLKCFGLDAEKGFKRSYVNSCLMNLDMSEPIQKSMYEGRYERIQTAWVEEIFEDGGDIFIDIGASFGYYTSLASNLINKMGTVFSFEPSLRASSHLYNVIRENNLDNVKLFSYAIGDREGLTSMQIPPINFESHSPSILIRPYQDKAWQAHLVPLISLDFFFDKELVEYSNKSIKCIKIDVEGYEPNAIKGMKNTLKKTDNILVEFNSGWLDSNNSSIEELMNLITSAGFFIHAKTPMITFYEVKLDKVCTLQDFWFKKLAS